MNKDIGDTKKTAGLVGFHCEGEITNDPLGGLFVRRGVHHQNARGLITGNGKNVWQVEWEITAITGLHIAAFIGDLYVCASRQQLADFLDARVCMRQCALPLFNQTQ